MIQSKNVKARLFLTYLKDKTELFLYVKPRGTIGSKSIYRRSPGDAAMSLRIDTLLETAGVERSEFEIWILLYPPEIRTTSIYAPSELSNDRIHKYIHENVLSNQPYLVNYDWNNYLLTRRDNGRDQDMVTITFIGNNVLPRIRSLLHRNASKINFIGDGLQFLRVDEEEFPQIRGKTYELILPYDEIYFKSIIRSGIHFESLGLPHGSSSEFGDYKLEAEQAYLKINQQPTSLDLPLFQPLVPRSIWKETFLTPAAFPCWYIASNSMLQAGDANFAERFHSENKARKFRQEKSIHPNYHYLT